MSTLINGIPFEWGTREGRYDTGEEYQYLTMLESSPARPAQIFGFRVSHSTGMLSAWGSPNGIKTFREIKKVELHTHPNSRQTYVRWEDSEPVFTEWLLRNHFKNAEWVTAWKKDGLCNEEREDREAEGRRSRGRQ